jgi:anti-anti-sigma factor
LVIPEIVDFPAEIDIRNSELLGAVLTAAIRPGAAVVIADLSRTEYCDGSGARSLRSAHEHAAQWGVELRVVTQAAQVCRMLALAAGDMQLRVYPDIKAALAGAADTAPGGFGAGSQDIQERYELALTRAHGLAGRVADTMARVSQQQPVSRDELLQKSGYARMFKRATTMPVIEQAKGILMFYEHCTPDEAFDLLRRASQRSNVPVRQIAAEIVDRTTTGTPASSRRGPGAPRVGATVRG